jgi:8-oxo-dGTP diphosphatase
MGAEAKARFVEPDIVSLDRIGFSFPEFGRWVKGVSYVLRPGGYGVISDDTKRIALVVTGGGVYLPGGGQEPGESALVALHREVLEECGLVVEVKSPIGMADELAFAEDLDQHFCKRCSFYSAVVIALGQVVETDHRLIWLEPDKALGQLSHGSQRWAVTEMVARFTKAELS